MSHRSLVARVLAVALVYSTLRVTEAYAQSSGNADTAFTFGVFGVGYGVTQFGEGLESRAEAGGFETSGGAVASLAVFRKFRHVRYVALGLRYKNLGASPARGDDGEEMFFNYWTTSLAVRAYPFDRRAVSGVFAQAEFVFATQFTQKYRNVARREYDHQFAIGSGLTGVIGYAYPLPGRRIALEAGVEFDYAARQGEVTGRGEVDFRNTNVGVMGRLRF